MNSLAIWSYDAPWDHLPKIQIASCHSLPVDHETRLLITNRSITHKLFLMRQYLQIYASPMSLTHWYQYHQILPPRIWWQLTSISLSFLWVIWSRTNLFFMWRHWNVTHPLMNFCKNLSFHMKATYCPVHLLPFKPSYVDIQFDKNAYPEMWKFWKNYEKDIIIPSQIFMIQNMSEQCQC